MYRVHLINFGRDVYEGDDLTLARSAAVKAGFESVIYQTQLPENPKWGREELPILSYSPISGWRGLIGCA
jgi:hypothetical protein